MRLSLPLAAFAILITAAIAQQVPRPAGEFVVNFSGGQLLLSQFSGKVVLLALMYTTWPHCQRTAQVLSGIEKDYGPKGLQILGVAYNPNAEQLVADFIQSYHVGFPVGFASRESVMEYLQHPPGKPTYVPELIFVDRNRVVRAQYTGSDDFFKDQDKNIRAMVEALVKETPAPKKSGSRARKTPS